MNENQQKEQELLEHKNEIEQHIQELNRVLEEKELSKREHNRLLQEIDRSQEQLLQNNLEVESVRNDYRNMERHYFDRQEELNEQTEQADTRARTADTKAKKAETRAKTAENLLTFSNKTNPVIDALNKFNNKMNQLHIFYKGEIKPNIKSISKMKIEDILNDFVILNYNFKDVSMQIKNILKKFLVLMVKQKKKSRFVF